MTIVAVHAFILHLPLTQSSISDSTHSITHWGVVGARNLDGRWGRGVRISQGHMHILPPTAL